MSKTAQAVPAPDRWGLGKIGKAGIRYGALFIGQTLLIGQFAQKIGANSHCLNDRTREGAPPSRMGW